MKKKIVVLLVILALVAAGVALVKKKQSRLAQEKAPESLAVVVEAKPLEAGAVTLTRRVSVDVSALREAVIASRLTAYVTELPLLEGSHFKRGDLLARLNPSQTSQGGANSLAADLAAAESAYQAEKERLHRSRSLYDIQGVSKEQLQATEAAFASAKARRAAAEEILRNATITAPFSGVVSQRLAQPGDLATPGKPLLKIFDSESGTRLLLTLPVDLAPVDLTVKGQTLPLQPWPEATLQGLRRFEARGGNEFLPGSRIDGQVAIYRAPQAVLVPHRCMFNGDGRSATVLALGDNGKVESLSVKLEGDGEEGAATLDQRLNGRKAACASPDILTRLAAGVPYRLQGQ